MDSNLLTLLMSAALFCITMTMTPGPNNVLLATSGANFGVRRTLPHLLGIRLGTTSLHLAVLLGLGSLFSQWPLLHEILKWLSIGYLAYLAIGIMLGGGASAGNRVSSKPMTIPEAAMFQWINPKSWMAVMTLCSAFTLAGQDYWQSALGGVLVFNLVGFPASFTWVWVGKAIARWLHTPRRRRGFNLTMGMALLSTLPMLLH
ncbi:LysE family translocator [Shewanella cyperi]|uniref:LysE family translocator n=1 Tax=Shewanella cyperi TaxID=2814292 RepID=A0A974XQJ3_9GAMM|nr:LysE family translocator [Shewanella cyperi]QSX31451.1 LysE family translocator [Shewanella cyperi]QSX42235.1 LysE family translocator [Shewanella cyperi]